MATRIIAASNAISLISARAAPVSGPIAFADVKNHSLHMADNLGFQVGPGPYSQSQSSGYAIATLDGAGGVTATTPAMAFQDDALMPGCNAAFDKHASRYIKTTTVKITQIPADPSSAQCKACPVGTVCCRDPTTPDDKGSCFGASDCSQLPVSSGAGGQVLTIDASTGAIQQNVSMIGDVVHPVFGAWDSNSQLMYTLVPYSYTEFGLFSINPQSGNVTKLAAWPKQQLDGIGLCEGLVMGNGKHLIYQFGGSQAYLTTIDLHSFSQVNRMKGFFGPLVQDPLFPNRLLALQNQHKNGISVMWLDPLSNETTQIFHMSNTSLGTDLRAQDQASMTVDDAGTRLWFIASYNVPDGHLYRGIFAIDLARDRSTATLKSEKASFGDDKGIWLGRLDYLQSVEPDIIV